jgi:hypothetical protein
MSSRASRTAQMIEAQMATVEANRALCSFSHAIATLHLAHVHPRFEYGPW